MSTLLLERRVKDVEGFRCSTWYSKPRNLCDNVAVDRMKQSLLTFYAYQGPFCQCVRSLWPVLFVSELLETQARSVNRESVQRGEDQPLGLADLVLNHDYRKS